MPKPTIYCSIRMVQHTLSAEQMPCDRGDQTANHCIAHTKAAVNNSEFEPGGALTL